VFRSLPGAPPGFARSLMMTSIVSTGARRGMA
jgi:hypothetical protein